MDGSNLAIIRHHATGTQASGVLLALSRALDLAEGEAPGHSMRCALIAASVGRAIGLDEGGLREVFLSALLKDLGSSGNAPRLVQLGVVDDRLFKREAKRVGDGLLDSVRFTLRHAGPRPRGTPRNRLRAAMRICRDGRAIARELVAARSAQGGELARQMDMPAALAQAIECIDERWDGAGWPRNLRGLSIPIASRIAALAQVAEAHFGDRGSDAAQREVVRRAGSGLDPQLAATFATLAGRAGFWGPLRDPDLALRLGHATLAASTPLDDDGFDRIATAFAQAADAKSAFTGGHAERVAALADRIGQLLGLGASRRRLLRRAALLHDLGKLALNSAILDHPGRLDATQWAAVRQHPDIAAELLARFDVTGDLPSIVGAHHEHVDGSGYPRGIAGARIRLESRIIAAADVFDALTSRRAHRDAMPVGRALAVMAKQAGTQLDPQCLEALRAALDEDAARRDPRRDAAAGAYAPRARHQPA